MAKKKRIKLSDTAAKPEPSSQPQDFRPPNDRPVNTDGRYPEARTPFPAAAGAVGSTPNGIPTFGQGQESGIKAGQRPPTQTAATGNTGTQIFGGYFSEEYLHHIRGRIGAAKWDEMRRSEAQVSLLMNAIQNPIKAANWDVEAYDESNPDFAKHAALVKHCLFEGIDFNTFKHEALTVLPFGFSLFEIVHSVVFNHPKFGTYNGISNVGFRSQKTIENWQLEPKTGRLLGVNQYTFSDLGGNEFIPGEFLVVFTHSKEGDNYEGISVLRPMLGAYMRKELYLKLAAIGIERYAIGTPIGTVPVGKERSKEYDEFLTVLQNYTSHEASYIVKPAGWDITIEKGDFDATKLKDLLTFENTEMVNALVANFLILGMNGGSGAYALGSNLGEFFTSGIQSYADLICDGINRSLIPQLVKLNFGDQVGYPKIKCTGITDKAGKDLGETIKLLADSRVLDPDMPLKEWLRKQYKMPKPDVNTATAMPAIPAGAAANFPKKNDPVVNPKTGKIEPFNPDQLVSETPPVNPRPTQLKEWANTIQLADKKYVAEFDANKAKLKKLMQAQLTSMYSKMRMQLRAKYLSLSGSQRVAAAKNIQLPGLVAYKSALKEALAEVAVSALVRARKQAPSRKKLSEYDALDPKVRALIDAQSSIIGDTQAADIEKMVAFQFTASAASSDDIDSILHDVDQNVDDSIAGATGEGMSIDVAAGDAVAHVTQNSSMAFFLDPEVSDGIESFTFTNEDPVSEICIAMTGTTVAPTDPILDQYACPLHHNCKSRWVPNLKGDDSSPEIGSGDAQENGGLSLSKKALASISLSERIQLCSV